MVQEFPNKVMERVYRRMEHYYSLAQWAVCPVQRWRYESLMMGEVKKFTELNRKARAELAETFHPTMKRDGARTTPD